MGIENILEKSGIERLWSDAGFEAFLLKAGNNLITIDFFEKNVPSITCPASCVSKFEFDGTLYWKFLNVRFKSTAIKNIEVEKK